MALIDWVSNTWQKVKSLPKKIVQVTKNTYQTLKSKAPTPKRIGSVLWKITVDGTVRVLTLLVFLLSCLAYHQKLSILPTLLLF